MDVNNDRNSNVAAGQSIRLLHMEQAQMIFASWRGQFEQLSRGRIDGNIQSVKGSLLQINQINVNQRVRVRGSDSAGTFSVYPINLKCSANLWQGRLLKPGQLVVTSVDTEFDHVASRDCEAIGVSVPFDTLETAARILLNSSKFQLVRYWTVMSPQNESFAKLQHTMRHLLSKGINNPAVIPLPEFRLHEETIIRRLVSILSSNDSTLDDFPRNNRANLVSRAEDLMRSRMESPLSAIEMCKELEVSDRTLRLAFLKHYGLGPMGYYKMIRLNAVRICLLSRTQQTIAEVARANGFGHLGNFSKDYNRLFHELPSQALKRSKAS